jgi:UPF0755 protein
MKKIINYTLFISFILVVVAGWTLLGPTVSAPEGGFLKIKTGSDFEKVKQTLSEEKVCNSIIFGFYAGLLHYEKHIKPGKYKISNNSNMLQLIRKLYSGRQDEVRLIINKLRTKEDLAKLISEQLEPDYDEALAFLTNNDSLRQLNSDSNTVMTLIVPNSYLFWWNGSMNKIMLRLKKQHDYFWERRTEKARALNLSPEQIYTIASIVEEETSRDSDKGKIASVYLNRLKKGMKLEADPTVKYAMRDFGLKRLLHGHLDFASPYNTYQVTGLPPGPICTPSISTIDAVLNAPHTDYIFFVAKPDFNGYSNFASNYKDHLNYAHQYQQALDQLQQKRK